jgi:hypothetical protein
VEIGIGLTGFFADFRDALMLAMMILYDSVEKKRAIHYATLGGIAAATLMLAVMWTGVKEDYRRELLHSPQEEPALTRLARVEVHATAWWERGEGRFLRDLDRLVKRVWAIPVQARALSRVPDVVPHQNGALFGDAVLHFLMPRLIFPEKKNLADADTDMVRRFSGLRANPHLATSIAFGYVAESYVDFGYFGMFFPIFAFGLGCGAAFRAIHRFITWKEVAFGVTVTIFWFSLFSYERSWAKMLGTFVALFIVVGGLGWMIDRIASRRYASAPRAAPSRAE